MSAIPAKGDLYDFSETTGYLLVQNRPLDCRPGCICGTCNGSTAITTEAVAEVIFWADNSIEAVSTSGRRAQLTAPHGDRCF